jgi:hypothetical protein
MDSASKICRTVGTIACQKVDDSPGSTMCRDPITYDCFDSQS